MVTLRKLCIMLRTDVAELKLMYETRGRPRHDFTDEELAELGARIQSLDTDVRRLVDIADDIVGDETRDADETRGGTLDEKAGLQHPNGRTGNGWCAQLKHYVCYPWNKMFKPRSAAVVVRRRNITC